MLHIKISSKKAWKLYKKLSFARSTRIFLIVSKLFNKYRKIESIRLLWAIYGHSSYFMHILEANPIFFIKNCRKISNPKMVEIKNFINDLDKNVQIEVFCRRVLLKSFF